MTAEPNLLSADEIPLRFYVCADSDWNETGVAWVALATFNESDNRCSPTVFPQKDAQTIATKLNKQLQEEIYKKYNISVNFLPVKDPQKTDDKSFNVVFQVCNNPWKRTNKSPESEKLLLAVQIADLLNQKSLGI
jgi:hypothetical protein